MISIDLSERESELDEMMNYVGRALTDILVNRNIRIFQKHIFCMTKLDL